MTNPFPPPPHQDPSKQVGPYQVSILEFVSMTISSLDRRFDSLHGDLKVDIEHRFDALIESVAQRFSDSDQRYRERYEGQQIALREALAATDKAVQAALIAQEKAVTKAEIASEKRFDAVNEFRAQLSDQATTFMPRAEAESRLSALAEKIDDLKESRDTSAGKGMGANALWIYIIGAVSLVSTIILLALRVSGK